MYRIFIVLVLAGALVACTNTGDSETDAADGSMAMGSPAMSGAAMGTASPECEEAFAPIAEMEVESTSDLGDLEAELQPTLENCESVDDWIAGADQAVEDDVNPSTAELLLGIQCNDPTLSDTSVCEEIASS
jgi:hypothetical protein